MFINVSNQEVTKSNCMQQAGNNIWLVSECLVSEMVASSHSILKWRSVSPKSCSENTRLTILTFCCLKLPALPLFNLRDCVHFKIPPTGRQRSQPCQQNIICFPGFWCIRQKPSAPRVPTLQIPAPTRNFTTYPGTNHFLRHIRWLQHLIPSSDYAFFFPTLWMCFFLKYIFLGKICMSYYRLSYFAGA